MGQPKNYPLHAAANAGDMKELKKQIKKHKDAINQLDDKHWTSLHCAANARSLECCNLLLSSNASAQVLTSTNNTPLHFLATMPPGKELLNTMKTLLKNNADITYPTVSGFTALHEAALRGAPGTVKFLIKNNAPVNFCGNNRVTALHCAIQGMSLENAKLLVKAGAKVDIEGYQEGTPLQLAKQLFSNEQYEEFKSCIRETLKLQSDKIFDLKPYSFDSLPKNIQELTLAAGIEPSSVQRNFPVFVKTFSLLYPELLTCPDRYIAKFEDNDPRGLYEIQEASGTGGFGRVYVAKDKQTKNLVAIKIIPHVERKQQELNYIELETLTRSQSRNVVTLLGAYHVKEKNEVWIVTEYLNGGMLLDLIAIMKKRKKSITEGHIAYVAKQVLEALAEIHKNHIVHRDIKSNNIIFTAHGELKVIDFGLALDLLGPTRKRFSTVGAPAWIAPEVVLRKPQTCSADLWGLGLMLIELANGTIPMSGNKIAAMFAVGTGTTYSLSNPSKWSEEMNHFIGKCLRHDPASRGTAEQLLQHEWLKKACSRVEISKIIVVHSIMIGDNFLQCGF